MNAPDLEYELLQAAAAMPWSAVQHLRGLGVAPATIARLTGAAMLGTASVELSADGSTWTPGGPTRRLLVGVTDLEFRPGEGWREVLVDIAALASHNRDEWALRTGQGWALGATGWWQALQADEQATASEESPRRRARNLALRLRLWPTPLDWLIAGGAEAAGQLCVLQWTPLALTNLRLLGEGVTIECEAAAKERLRAMLAYGGLPRVEVAGAPQGIAA